MKKPLLLLTLALAGTMTFDIFAGPQFKDVSSKVTYDMNTLLGTVDGEDVFPERIGID